MPGSLRFTLWIAVLATLVNAVAYALTFADRSSYWLLFSLPLLFLVWPGVIAQWRRVPRRNLASEVFGNIPRWMKLAVVGLLLFAFANYFVCRTLNDSAQPEPRPEGRFALVAKGQVVRELSTADYHHARAVQFRMMSGFFIACFGLAALLAEACWIKNGPAMADRHL